jgi:putative ABC transport system ATP-binding protein
MLNIEDLCIAYGGRDVVSGFSLHLAPGESACISGESGCGKTSLLSAVMGFVDPRSGRIVVDGIELGRTTVDAVRRRIAWIPQELALPVEWVSDMVKMPFELKHNRAADFSEERLMQCFDQLALSRSIYTKRVKEISGGQRQRVMIAVASMLRKPLVIVDEPTSALDRDSSARVLNFLRSLTDGGTAVLAVSHDLTFVQGCHRHVMLTPQCDSATK